MEFSSFVAFLLNHLLLITVIDTWFSLYFKMFTAKYHISNSSKDLESELHKSYFIAWDCHLLYKI